MGLLAEQATALATREPDVIALQEITARSWPLWRAALATIGLPQRLRPRPPTPRASRSARRRTGVLLATREAAVAAAPLPSLARRQRSRRPRCGDRARAHVPNAANGWMKPPRPSPRCAPGCEAESRPAVLCGDLNTPRRELRTAA